MRFADATAVTPLGDGVYRSEIHDGWDIAGNANGGYLLALAARMMQDAAERPDPVSITAHYLAPGRPGPVDGRVAVHKRGRAFATASATLDFGDRTGLTVVGAFGDLERAEGPERVDASPPDLPDPDDCPQTEPGDGFPPPIMGQVDLRLHPEDVGFATGQKSGIPRVRGWFRLADGQPLDTLALLLAVDAFPPTIFNADLPVAWTPTVELTAHVRARPRPDEWLRCAFTTRFVTGGFLEEDGEIWNEAGHLVAQSRQLALVPRA